MVLSWIKELLPLIPLHDTTPIEEFFARVTRDNMMSLAGMGADHDDREVIMVDFQTLLAVWQRLGPGDEKGMIGRTLKASPLFANSDKPLQADNSKENSPPTLVLPRQRFTRSEKGKSPTLEVAIAIQTGEKVRTGDKVSTVGGHLAFNAQTAAHGSMSSGLDPLNVRIKRIYLVIMLRQPNWAPSIRVRYFSFGP